MARTWVDVQKRTFTGWANNFLKERILKINDIETDLEDGVMLINLLEIISSKALGKYNKTPRGRFQKIENNGFAVKFIASEGLKLVGIGAEDIVDGKIKLILGLIWTLILRYQIQMISAVGDDSPKQALLAWVRKQIESYGVPVDNFDKSWQDGRALAALTDSLKKGCFPLNTLSGDAVNDINKAMDISEASFEIPKIMDPSDLANIPDELSVMTYVSYFRDYAVNREKLMAEEHAAEQERLKVRADPSKCYADGPGLEGGFNHEPAMFTIHAKNFFDEPLTNGGEQFHIEVVDEHGGAVQAQITDKKDGTYNAAYMPETPGKYTVKVSLNGTSIKNLPVTVNIDGSDQTHSYAEGPGLSRAEVGKPARFTIYARNSKGEPLKRGAEPFTVWISKGESGESEVQVDIKDNEDGTYSVEYQPLEAGPKVIHIQLREKYIKDAPFKLHSFGATPENSYAEGPGLEKGQAHKPANFTIHGIGSDGAPFKSDENNFTVDIEGPHPTTAQMKDNGDGTYAVTYTPTEPGDYTVHVKLFGHPIKDTPVKVHFKPSADATHSSIEDLKPGQAEVPQSFKIVARDAKGNPRTDGGDVFLVDLVGPDGAKAPGVQVVDNGDGTYDVKFTPTEPGDYKVQVLVGGDTPLANTSDLHIKPAPSAQNSYAEGPGLDSGKVFDNEPAKFKIHAVDPKGQPRQDGGDAFHVDIIGPQGAPAVKADVHDNGDGTYDVTYEPTVAGDYKVEVQLDHPTGHKTHIKNSPHSVTVREGTDGSLSAFGKFTITIVANDKHKKPKTFGGDPFEVSIKGPAEQISISAIDNQDGTYTAAYALVGSGRFDVEVKLNGKNIEGSPFKQVLGSGKRDKSVPVHTSTARAN